MIKYSVVHFESLVKSEILGYISETTLVYAVVVRPTGEENTFEGLALNFLITFFSRYYDKGSKIERQQHRAEFRRRLAIRVYSRLTIFFQPNFFYRLCLNKAFTESSLKLTEGA